MPASTPLGPRASACSRRAWASSISPAPPATTPIGDRRLGGSAVTQAHPTGYPIYRLEWQAVGSLQRRMRGCMVGVRAEPFAYGAAEFIALELYLNSRAAGLPIETPGVRP